MRPFLILALLMFTFYSCETGEDSGEEVLTTDTINNIPDEIDNTTVDIDTAATAIFGNEAFRNITIEKIGNSQYSIKGEARVNEGIVYYDIEDGHNMLVDSFTTASKASPSFGNLNFIVDIQKNRPNSTLMLVLYEENAAGSRVNELAIPIPANDPI